MTTSRSACSRISGSEVETCVRSSSWDTVWMSSTTSSSSSASAWMSSRSKGVTNDEFSLVRIALVISSPSCSEALIRSWPSEAPSEMTSRRCRAQAAALAEARLKSGKNESSVGSSRNRTAGR
jgi:hypothetical protein